MKTRNDDDTMKAMMKDETPKYSIAKRQETKLTVIPRRQEQLERRLGRYMDTR